MAAPTLPDLGSLYESTPPEDRDDLEATLQGAVAWVERHCGPFAVSRAFSKVVMTGGGAVRLGLPALRTVTSVTTAQSKAIGIQQVDTSRGVVVIDATSVQPLTFVGTQGYPSGEPDEMRLAAVLLAKHRWTHREGLNTSRRPDGYSSAPLNGYAVPNAVRDLVREVQRLSLRRTA